MGARGQRAHSGLFETSMNIDGNGKVGLVTQLDRFLPVALQWSTALMFLAAWPKYPSATAVHFGKLMELEFLAIHAGAFLGMLVLWVPKKPSSRLLRAIGVAFFCALYLLGGYRTLHWQGMFELGWMILASYSGLLWGVGADRKQRIMETGSRWFFGFMIFLFVIHWRGLPSDVATWHKNADSLLAGAIYFAVLGMLELSGIYRFVRKNADSLWPHAK